MSVTVTPTAADYARVFAAEQVQSYPVVDVFEAECGFALDRTKLEMAARVLACPVKKNQPNWQHGRVLYAAARRYLDGKPAGGWTFLDVGTAKGFSALCLHWALMDHAGGVTTWGVTSVDVIDPMARVTRNTVAECDGLKTLAETLVPWPEASECISFVQSSGVSWLKEWSRERRHVDVAFIDGKHAGAVVAEEGRLLSGLQRPGDLAIFDDVHLGDVGLAVDGLSDLYDLRTLRILANRAYAIGVRRE